MIHLVYLTSSKATRTHCLSVKQGLPINNRPHTLNLNSSSGRRPIKLEMAAGDSTTTSANFDRNPGAVGLTHELLAEQVPKLNGGKYDLLVLL